MRYVDESREVGTKSGRVVTWMQIICDTLADLPAPDAYDGIIICMGSRAFVIADGSKHVLQSGGQWVQQGASSATYTRAEIDSIVQQINADNAAQQSIIDYLTNTGAKNYCPYDGFTASAAGTAINDQPIDLPAGEYIITFDYTETTGSNSIRFLDSGTSIVNFTINNTTAGKADRQFTLSAAANQIRFYTGVANTVTKLMIRPAAITDSTFQPYAPTNRQLYELIKQYHP